MIATGTQPLNVLLVDDDFLVHEMLGMMINQEDYSLLSAANVKEALELIASTPIDLIITDAMMPGESGFSLIEKVKADPRHWHIPIILLTILQQPDGSAMDATGKADFSVNKPLYLSDINAALERARQLIGHRKIVNARVPEIADRVDFMMPEPTDSIEVVI